MFITFVLKQKYDIYNIYLNMENIHSTLESIGLTDTEIRLYLYLLENGLSTPPQIAKGTRMLRPNCYDVLRRLRQKGLIEEHRKGKRYVYAASDLTALLQSWERKKDMLEQILPDLRGLFTVQKNKPKIQFYDGWEQVKTIFDQTLSAQEIYGIASTEKLFAQDPSFFKRYQKELKKRGIIFHDILTNASKQTAGPQAKEMLRGFYEMEFLPARYEDTPVDLLIWNNHVALVAVSEPIFGTVITHPHIAQLFRILFDLAWRHLRQ